MLDLGVYNIDVFVSSFTIGYVLDTVYFIEWHIRVFGNIGALKFGVLVP